jgi:hypothetical protein
MNTSESTGIRCKYSRKSDAMYLSKFKAQMMALLNIWCPLFGQEVLKKYKVTTIPQMWKHIHLQPQSREAIIDPSLLSMDHAVSGPPPAACPYPHPCPIIRGQTNVSTLTTEAGVLDLTGHVYRGVGSCLAGESAQHVPTTSDLNVANEVAFIGRSDPSEPASAGLDAGNKTLSPVPMETDLIRQVLHMWAWMQEKIPSALSPMIQTQYGRCPHMWDWV